MANEYALVIVKPDGVKNDKENEVLNFFERNGIKPIKRSCKRATKAVVDDIFTSKHNGAFYKRYMTSGEMIAYLMEGDNGFEKCRVLKNELRKKLDVDKLIENICHTPEPGNEYMKQLRFFFPECCDEKYHLYGDVYCKVYAFSDYEYMKKYMNNCKSKTNSKLTFVFGNEELYEYKANIKKYFQENTEYDIFGIEYIAAIGKEKIKIIGYYKSNIIDSMEHDYIYFYRSIQDILNIISKNNGIPVWGYNSKIESLTQFLGKYFLKGLIVYHPMYSIKDTEALRDYAEKYNLITLGGSGGNHPGECSVSYCLYDKFEKVVMEG